MLLNVFCLEVSAYMFENNDSILRVFKVIELCESKLIKDNDKDKEKKRQWRYHIENLVLGACVKIIFLSININIYYGYNWVFMVKIA